MTSFRWRCCLAALLMAAGGSAWAQDGAPAASDCDMLCRLQAYMAADHMVVLAPAATAAPAARSRKSAAAARRASAKTPKIVTPKTVTPKTVTPKTVTPKTVTLKTAVRKTAARQIAIHKAAPSASPIAVASPLRPAAPKHIDAARRKGPLPQVVATAQPEVPAPPKPARRATAWQRRTLIPGSAPMTAGQFSPAQR